MAKNTVADTHICRRLYAWCLLITSTVCSVMNHWTESEWICNMPKPGIRGKQVYDL